MARLTPLFVGAVLLFCPTFEAVPTAKKRPSLDDARLEFLSKWNRIANLYETDQNAHDAINYINWYHRESSRGTFKDVDPRPPAVDIPSIPFECDTQFGTSPQTPQSAHALRPGDITVIGAFGDSITAGNGNGAENVLGVITQNRGESWCVGGDFTLELNVTTIPNMIRKYNPNVKGHSDCGTGVQDFEYSWFNVAVPGARAVHLPEQADDLINKMKNDPRIVYAKDWKMVTLFIGGNDFCSYCSDREDRTPEIFISHIREALDKLHDQMPRVLVNLVPMAHVGLVQNVTFHHPNTTYPDDPDPDWLYPWGCDLFHNIFCSCVMNTTTREELKQVQQDYYHKMKELVDSRRYDSKADFTVVLQPHLKDQEPMMDPITGMTDNRYFSPDCFHPNRRMHQLFAYLLWNTMFTKVGEKPTNSHPDDWPTYVCPTEQNPYIYTHVNSVDPPVVDKATSVHGQVITALLITGILSVLRI